MLQAIHESIDWLHRLSNLVRKSSFVNQNRRAEDFQLRDSEGKKSQELTDKMTAGLRELYKHVINRTADGLEDFLTDRLIETMITRHKRILYRRSRQISWAISQVHYTTKRAGTPKEFGQLHRPEPIPLIQESEIFKSDCGPMLERRIKQPQDKATTLNVGTYRKVVAQSRLSKASSAPLKRQEQILVHPPLKAAREGGNVVCPYCCLILQSREACNPTTWT